MSLVGRLEDLALSDIFQILSIGKKTGMLLINGTAGSAVIVFKNGLVVKAEATTLDGTLGHDLMYSGLIDEEALNRSLVVKKNLPDKSIADILVELGSVSKDILEKAAKKRIERVVCQLLLWEDGDFQFELDDLDIKGKIEIEDSGWEVAKGMSPEYLLMEGARTHDESSKQDISFTEEEITDEKKEETEWDADWGMEQPVPERKDISALMALTQELRFPNSSSEITLLILRFASDMFQRGVLFMSSQDEIIGLGQFGLDIDKADEKVRALRLILEASPLFSKVVKDRNVYKGHLEKDNITEFVMKEFGGGWPVEVVIFPVVAEGKTVAVLYCDNLPKSDGIGNTEGLEIFVTQAGLALEKSLLQRRLQDMQKNNGNKG
ncbi:MAG: DUF4388 domain-containing protein [Nitrospiraceae bacterium]|nr:DUF4388 domain-containing protein [Nitrospiraceae bacterium]